MRDRSMTDRGGMCKKLPHVNRRLVIRTDTEPQRRDVWADREKSGTIAESETMDGTRE